VATSNRLETSTIGDHVTYRLPNGSRSHRFSVLGVPNESTDRPGRDAYRDIYGLFSVLSPNVYL